MSQPKFVVPCLICLLSCGVFMAAPISAQPRNARSSKKGDAAVNAQGPSQTEAVSSGAPSGDRIGLPSRLNRNNGNEDQNAGKKPVPSDGSEFKIPSGASPKELMDMANGLLNTERDFETEEEYKTWVNQMIQTVYNIASNVLKMEVDDELYLKAAGLKGEMIYYHVWTKPEAYATYEKYVRALQKDKRLLGIKGGQDVADGQLASYLHEGCVRTVQADGSVDDLKKYVGEFQELVMRNPDFVSMIPDIVYPVNELSVSKKDPKMMKELFFQFAAEMKKSEDQTLKEAAAGLEGILRFAELEGKPMQVVGTTVEGDKFSSASLKGKVYLVNFWATWVTPCLAQYPELLALYIQYKDKGFEIVGYNMDEELDPFKDYVSSKKIPWPNISEKMSLDNKQPSLSEFYGITTIPTLILVGEDGKVIENDIDVEQLKTKLTELYK